MLMSLIQGPLLRLLSVGLILLALQRTLFTDLTPFGVVVQVMLALAAAAGAASGPQKGALAGFVLGVMYDLGSNTPLGSSSITMGLAGFAAGYVMSLTVDPQWWLAAIFTGLGAAVGEAAVPVVRAFIGEEQAFGPRYGVAVAVVSVAAMVLSPVFVPLGRWCMRIKRVEWRAVPQESSA
jgi:rod shape-determining protein MreD